MIMKNEKEIWVENMMRTASKPASSLNAKEAVLNKIFHVLDQPKGRNNIISFKQFKLAGLAAVLLLALNIGVIGFTMIKKESKMENTPAYGLNTYNLDLY